MSSKNVLALISLLEPARDGWHFGANDNSVGGWVIFCLYIILSCLCWIEVTHQFTKRRLETRRLTLPPLFWLGLASSVTLLGINKQPDFQTWFLQEAGRIAMSAGIYRYRRLMQLAFVSSATIASLFIMIRFWRLARNATKQERFVLLGTAALLGFVLLRVADINHLGELIGLNLDRRRLLVAMESTILIFLGIAISFIR